ncbi:MAG: ATP-dependent Clp protease proteolytic subunit [Bacteroidetes bacterium]|nr:ATP-dependent Clp protease proteolytic subunit [Bacteroidota bacterium]
MTGEKDYRFECSAQAEGTSYTVQLSGYIKRNNKNAAASVRAMLDKAPAGAKVTVRLKDFFGGDIQEGLAIHKDLQARAVAMEADGLVASMGTVIMCAGSPVRATRRMKGMMHRASAEMKGTADDLVAVAAELKALEGQLVTILAERSGLTDESARAKFMAEGRDTWFTAEQLQELGLVDEVVASEVRTVPVRELPKLKTPEAALARFAACYEEQTPDTGKPKAMNKKITAALGLADGAEDSAVEARIEAVLAENATLKAEAEAVAKATAARELTAAVGAIDAALAADRITKAQADALKEDAKQAPAMVAKMLGTLVAGLPAHRSLSASLGTPGPGKNRSLEAVYAKRVEKGWDFVRWSKEASADLVKLKAEHPELYTQLRETL